MDSHRLPAALPLLADQRNQAADAALVEVLPRLSPDEQSAAFEILARRAHGPSLAALVGRFNESTERLQSLIIDHGGDLSAGVRLAASGASFEGRASAIEVIARSDNGKLAYLLADALRSRCGRTRRLAAKALNGMTARVIDGLDTAPPPDELGELLGRADALADALRQGVMTWEIHLQPEALKAALWMGGRLEGAIRKKLLERRSKIARAISGILERTSDPRLAGFALRALAIEPLRDSAARAIGGARSNAFIRAVLDQSWLLDIPDIELGCRRIRHRRWLRPDADELSRLNALEAVRAVRLLGAVSGSNEEKAAVLADCIGTGDAEFRHAVVWHLVNDTSNAATDLLTGVAARLGDDTAKIAARDLDRRQAASRRKPAAHETVEGSTTGSPAHRAFERFWHNLDSLKGEDIMELLAQMRAVADELLDPIRTKLADPRPFDRIRALRMAVALGLTKDLDKQLFRLAHDPDSAARSLAVAALAELPGSTSRRILRAAVNDPNERVQANAIEALDRLDAEDRLAVTRPKLESRNARVRANAVKSLLRNELREAGEVLIDMLENPSSAHRLSALWVAERLRLQSILERIRDIGLNDPNERVRRRATRALRRLGGRPPGRSGSPESASGPSGTGNRGDSQ